MVMYCILCPVGHSTNLQYLYRVNTRRYAKGNQPLKYILHTLAECSLALLLIQLMLQRPGLDALHIPIQHNLPLPHPLR